MTWVKDLDTALPRPPWGDVFISWLGAFLAILAISGVNQALLPELHASVLVASFGVHPLPGPLAPELLSEAHERLLLAASTHEVRPTIRACSLVNRA